MKTLSFIFRRQPLVPIRFALIAWVALFSVALSRAETLITCTGDPGGDLYYRGFYIPNYPGNTLDSVQLRYSARTAGAYRIILTARRNAYNGAVLGSSTVTVNLNGSDTENRAVTFAFPSVRITEGSRVCFIQTLDSGPSTSLYYSVPAPGVGCTDVIQTDGTSAPLDDFRRNGVNIVVRGQDTLIVAPNESIQAAINAANVGDTVHVDAGTYTENITLRTGVNVVGAGYNATTLRGTGTETVVTAINVTDARMEGFKITRSGTDIGEAGVNISGGNVQINNNWIIGNLNGVRIIGGSSAIIRNNIIQRNGSAGNGVLDYGVVCLSSTPLIANNLIVSNTGAGLYFAWAASTGAQVINNTVADNENDGIWCYNNANVTIKNNIFTGNNGGISASHGAAPLISFNDVWDNGAQNYNAQSGGIAAAGPGDISADPLYDTSSSPPFALSFGSPCINAGDPSPLYNDRDGSRNDMGCFGGPSGLLGGLGSAVTSGFLFNNIGKIPTSEITKVGARAGLANVDPAVASALHIYQYQDAPFGGNLWLHGLFGSSDTAVRYYRIYAAKWTGVTPPAESAFQPVTDPLSKIKYTVGPGGTVTHTLENIGPDSNGLYLRTDTGYWAHPDLMMIWNTPSLDNGRYDLICKGYFLFFGIPIEASLPDNALSRITVWVNNDRVTAEINSVRDHLGTPIPECGIIPLASNAQNLQFEITAHHPGGFLRDYTLDALYGRNRHGGVVANDRYAGVHDSTPPSWPGVSGVISNSAPAHASGALLPWTSCAYQFRLTAWARTTDGFNHIYWDSFSDHYSLNVGAAVPTACIADLDADGDVDGADLAIFAAQFGRTDCAVPASP